MQFLYDVFPYAVAFTVPLLLAALGGLISERSGVVNIALDGMMIIGAFVSAIFIYLYSSMPGTTEVWIGILLAGVVTAIFSLLHAYASITLNANQVISGTALNMLAPALTIFLARLITGTQNISLTQGVPRSSTVTFADIPLIGGLIEKMSASVGAISFTSIPIVGKLFFKDAYLTTLIALIILAIVWYVVFHTKFGLRLRACGENPQAADSMGINVYKMRYIGVVASGFLGGLAGAVYTTTTAGSFGGSVQGLGFLALGALIFGKWLPLQVLGASFFFAFAKTLGDVASVNSTLKALSIPQEFYNALPYIATIIALVIFSKNIVGPKAAGEPYDKGKR